MPTYRIEVTQEDIDKGVKSKCEHCPIARAVNRAIPGARSFVGAVCIMAYLPDGRELRGNTCKEINDFIEMFDAGEPVEPFMFDILMEECS